jgi:hypothetical protein
MSHSLLPLEDAKHGESSFDPDIKRLEYLVEQLNTSDDPHERQILVNDIWKMLN